MATAGESRGCWSIGRKEVALVAVTRVIVCGFIRIIYLCAYKPMQASERKKNKEISYFKDTLKHAYSLVSIDMITVKRDQSINTSNNISYFVQVSLYAVLHKNCCTTIKCVAWINKGCMTHNNLGRNMDGHTYVKQMVGLPYSSRLLFEW